MPTPIEKLQELKNKITSFSRKNDERIASKKMYEQKLKDEFFCESIEDGEDQLNSLIKKKKKIDSEIEEELEKLEQDMISCGILGKDE